MGFVGGGGNIAIATALPLYCKHQIVYGFSFSFFMVACYFSLWMWRQTLARIFLYRLSAEYSVLMCRAWPGTLVTSSQYDILLCSETLVSDMRHVSEVLVPFFLPPCLVVSGQDASGPWDGCIRLRWLRSILPIQI